MDLYKYCHKHNGDHFDDEEDRYDYYSCEVMNEIDLEKYGHYDSKENEVDETKCKYYGCETCAIVPEPKKEEFYIGNVKVIRDANSCNMYFVPRENNKIEVKEKKYSEQLLDEYYRLRDNWEDLKKWLEKQMEDRQCKNDFERYTAYEAVLNKMIGLEGRKNDGIG